MKDPLISNKQTLIGFTACIITQYIIMHMGVLESLQE